MKKPEKKYIITEEDENNNIIKKSQALYETRQKNTKKEISFKDFTYGHFKTIADKSPFTINEWANILYISERSLHRYAKDGGGFNGLQIERILLLAALIDLGNDLFGKSGFKQWMQSRPFSFNGAIVKEKLLTYHGIQDVIDTLHRMQQGIPA